MAELVDATDLKSVDLLIVRVRFPLSVLLKKWLCLFLAAFRPLSEKRKLLLGRSLGLDQIPDRDLVSQFQHDSESIGAEADVTDISDFNRAE